MQFILIQSLRHLLSKKSLTDEVVVFYLPANPSSDSSAWPEDVDWRGHGTLVMHLQLSDRGSARSDVTGNNQQ
ncbi:unnamed protein product [Plutella xylostella]|uniref:(diamondback moth) hypothetical protein n=1 Tax=Plutella xylostella TaxID=51655 RepID=A0A8S4GEA7_PLUXY|nr:unnamed protein product [Plutella xylostella]